MNDLKVGGLSRQTGTVVHDFRVNLAGGNIDQRHGFRSPGSFHSIEFSASQLGDEDGIALHATAKNHAWSICCEHFSENPALA